MGDETLRERGGVEYRELKSRSLLNRCDAPRMPFTWTVNPYRGCAMSCRYCYAAYTHEFLGIEGADFHSLIYVKTGAEQETERRLAAVVRTGETIALGTATDPYQPGEAEAKVTRRFLEMVARHRNARLGIVTKGALILRDLELLQTIHRRSRLSVHVSLVSPHPELIRKLDPWAPPPDVRIEVMRRLVAAGVPRMFTNVLFLRAPTREKFLKWLGAEFPRYLEAYQRAYATRVYLEGPYRQAIDATVRRLKQKHGFEDRRDDHGWRRPEQTSLW